VGGFFFGALLRLGKEAADVGKSTGTAWSDTVGGESHKEFAENVVDINLGDEIAGGESESGGEIVFAWFGFGAAAVDEAKSVMLGMSGEAAEAAIGEFKLAKIEDIGWSRV
jgi:hypothetical protein